MKPDAQPARDRALEYRERHIDRASNWLENEDLCGYPEDSKLADRLAALLKFTADGARREEAEKVNSEWQTAIEQAVADRALWNQAQPRDEWLRDQILKRVKP